jgi:hypothetical protein
MASCEVCIRAFEYDAENPDDTLLPTTQPGTHCEYHFMSYGWLVAGTVVGSFILKHGSSPNNVVTYADVYKAVLYPKLSDSLKYDLGFCPMGGGSSSLSSDSTFVLANTVTSDVSASKMMQEHRERELLDSTTSAAAADNDNNNNNSSVVRDDHPVKRTEIDESTLEIMRVFKGVEFLLDPRIWNSYDSIHANVPAASGRFSAIALAQFYHELGNNQSILSNSTLHNIITDIDKKGVETVTVSSSSSTTTSAMQGVTRIGVTDDDDDESGGSGRRRRHPHNRTKLNLGYQLIQTERDQENTYSGIGHSGVGGSIGFWHKPSGLAIGLMFNKADGGETVTLAILKVICDYYNI